MQFNALRTYKFPPPLFLELFPSIVVKITIYIIRSYDFTISPSHNDLTRMQNLEMGQSSAILKMLIFRFGFATSIPKTAMESSQTLASSPLLTSPPSPMFSDQQSEKIGEKREWQKQVILLVSAFHDCGCKTRSCFVLVPT